MSKASQSITSFVTLLIKKKSTIYIMEILVNQIYEAPFEGQIYESDALQVL
jgi:hypothetical protein